MKRRLFNAIAVVSALLCVATLVFWLLSEADPLQQEHMGAHFGPNGGILPGPSDWGWNISSRDGVLVIYTENESNLFWDVRYPVLALAFLSFPVWLFLRRHIDEQRTGATPAIPPSRA